MADVATIEPRAEVSTNQLSSYAVRYRSDTKFAERQRAKVNEAYQVMPEDKKAALIVKKTAKYFSSSEIQERQRRTSREYYHKKKAALQVSQTAVSLVF